MSKKRRSEAEKSKTRAHVARNKIRRIEIALRTAGGQAKETLVQRLEFWKNKLK